MQPKNVHVRVAMACVQLVVRSAQYDISQMLLLIMRRLRGPDRNLGALSFQSKLLLIRHDPMVDLIQ